MPDNNITTVTEPGEIGLLFFTDTSDVSEKGHGCYYPGATETIFLQIPTKDGGVPDHEVLSDDGPCTGRDYAVLRGWATNAS